MNLRRPILAAVLVTVALIGAVGWGVYNSLRQIDIPEAYAAWDTGTLLVEYMSLHDNRWPASWDDLLSVLEDDSDRPVRLTGGHGDMEYARSLREKVSIDWRFDPRHPGPHDPVTRPDGSPFRTLWEGGDPNDMVQAHLAQPTTRPSPTP